MNKIHTQRILLHKVSQTRQTDYDLLIQIILLASASVDRRLHIFHKRIQLLGWFAATSSFVNAKKHENVLTAGTSVVNIAIPIIGPPE